MAASDIALKYVIPAFGVAVGNCMFGTPMKAVLKVRREKTLGELNPLPLALITANCVGWTIYACIVSDYFVFIGNFPGLLMGLFFVASCTQYSSQKIQDLMMVVYIAAAALFALVGFISAVKVQDQDSRKTLWGCSAVAALAFYYAAPLSTMAKVIRTRCSSSLYWPLCIMNVINGALWTAYGLAIKDWFIGVPNGYGTLTSLVAVALCIMYPRDPAELQKSDSRMWSTAWLLRRGSSTAASSSNLQADARTELGDVDKA